MTPGKGSKYREFYDLSGRITCMLPIPGFSAVTGKGEKWAIYFIFYTLISLIMINLFIYFFSHLFIFFHNLLVT